MDKALRQLPVNHGQLYMVNNFYKLKVDKDLLLLIFLFLNASLFNGFKFLSFNLEWMVKWIIFNIYRWLTRFFLAFLIRWSHALLLLFSI